VTSSDQPQPPGSQPPGSQPPGSPLRDDQPDGPLRPTDDEGALPDPDDGAPAGSVPPVHEEPGQSEAEAAVQEENAETSLDQPSS
jgi:hypothetical protein